MVFAQMMNRSQPMPMPEIYYQPDPSMMPAHPLMMPTCPPQLPPAGIDFQVAKEDPNYNNSVFVNDPRDYFSNDQ